MTERTTDVISGVAVTLRAGRKFAYAQEILQLADSVVDLGAPAGKSVLKSRHGADLRHKITLILGPSWDQARTVVHGEGRAPVELLARASRIIQLWDQGK